MTIGPTALHGDARSLDALRASAAREPKAALREAARQFEALFMQELVKSMRQATMSAGLLDNSGTQLGTELLDMQFANKLTGMPGGLAEAIARQLERQAGAARAPSASAAPFPIPTRQAAFVAQHGEAARAAEATTGIPAAFMIAQAAHESGWGQREIRNACGMSAHNLFGLKAGAGWKGSVAEVTTTEFVDGQPHKVTARFRAYDSYSAAFADYARLMKDSPRYRHVLAAASSAEGFAQGLQRAGYATDPNYADKLSRVIETTLRVQGARG